MSGKVLVTGVSGFLGAHVLDVLVRNQYPVIAVVRNIAEEAAHKARYPGALLAFVEVPDVSGENALDFVFKLNPDIRYVIHLANPRVPCLGQPAGATCPFHATDAKESDHALFDPAIRTSLNVIDAVDKHGPNVRSVVVSSCFAAMMNDPPRLNDPRKLYTSRDLNRIPRERARQDCHHAYLGACSFAEDVLWKRYSDVFASFTLTVIVTPMLLGPILQGDRFNPLSRSFLDHNPSLREAASLMQGCLETTSGTANHQQTSTPIDSSTSASLPSRSRSSSSVSPPLGVSLSPLDISSSPLASPAPSPATASRSVSSSTTSASTTPSSPSDVVPFSLPFYVDVRDAAIAYVRAIQLVPAETNRWFVVANNVSSQQVVDIARSSLPGVCKRMPVGHPGQGDTLILKQCAFDTSDSADVVGIKYRSLDDTVVSMYSRFLELEQAAHPQMADPDDGDLYW